MKRPLNSDINCDTKSPVASKKIDGFEAMPKSAGSASKKSKKLMERSPTKKSADLSKHSSGSPAKEKFTKDITDVAGKRLPKIVSLNCFSDVVSRSLSKRSWYSWCQRTFQK